jgi:hypothetical protein
MDIGAILGKNVEKPILYLIQPALVAGAVPGSGFPMLRRATMVYDTCIHVHATGRTR